MVKITELRTCKKCEHNRVPALCGKLFKNILAFDITIRQKKITCHNLSVDHFMHSFSMNDHYITIFLHFYILVSTKFLLFNDCVDNKILFIVYRGVYIIAIYAILKRTFFCNYQYWTWVIAPG